MTVPDWLRLRTAFEEVPELYHRPRPNYPEVVFDELVEMGRLPAEGYVLEIGCGTGQATLPLAQRGFELVCVELGERLAGLARQNLRAFPDVEIVNAAFESWEPGARRFDAVVAFTAFHWIDPEVRYARAAALLRPWGALAVVATSHVQSGVVDRFWHDVQADYDALVPSEHNRPPPLAADVDELSAEIAASGYFENGAVRRYLWQVSYTAPEYVAVLETYSGHRELQRGLREQLYERIQRRIEAEPNRCVTKTYLATLNVARLLPG